MDINELTLGQIKQLQSALSSDSSKKSGLSYPIGSYVIVRSYNEGLNAGFLVEADETGCIIEQARRIWRSRSKNPGPSWYEGIAQNGLDQTAIVSCAVKNKIIVERYSLTVCTAEAQASIQEHPANENSF